MAKRAEETDWLKQSDQELWFKAYSTDGCMKFPQFQKFLANSIYSYFRDFPPPSSETTKQSVDNREDIYKFTYQQELQLFKRFDLKNDHAIDLDEFAQLAESWLEQTFHPCTALVVIDVQNDFIDGSMALIKGPAGEDGAEVVPVINSLLEKFPFDVVVYTQDWHPIDHISFIDNLHLRKYATKNGREKVTAASQGDENKELPTINSKLKDKFDDNIKFKVKKLAREVKVYDTVWFDEGRMEQRLWPIHCVQDSWGAELHPELKLVPDALRVYKGSLSHIDSYSAFWDNMHTKETNLRHELLCRKTNQVFVCGLAFDYCVAVSALDSVEAGFVTLVVEDGCRGIEVSEMESKREDMLSKGVLMVQSEILLNQTGGRLPLDLIKSICLRSGLMRRNY